MDIMITSWWSTLGSSGSILRSHYVIEKAIKLKSLRKYETKIYRYFTQNQILGFD